MAIPFGPLGRRLGSNHQVRPGTHKGSCLSPVSLSLPLPKSTAPCKSRAHFSSRFSSSRMSTCGYRTQAPVSRGSESFSKGAVVLTDYLTCRSYSVAHPKDEIRPQPLMFNVVAKILLLPLCCTPPADMRTSFSHRPRCKSQVRASKPPCAYSILSCDGGW